MTTDKIKNRLKILDDIKKETKKVRQQQKEQKLKMKNDPQIAEYELQLKELREDMKENKEILAQELVDYYKETGKMEIVDDDGKTKRIVFSAKLVRG